LTNFQISSKTSGRTFRVTSGGALIGTSGVNPGNNCGGTLKKTFGRTFIGTFGNLSAETPWRTSKTTLREFISKGFSKELLQELQESFLVELP